MGKIKNICIGLAMVAQALGQSATNFAPQPVTTAPSPQQVAPEKAKPAVAAPTAASANAGTPARLVGPAELEDHMTSMVSVFHAMSREKDPFGQFQDPDAKPVVRTVSRGIARRAPAKATPLGEIFGYLPITTIMPGDRSFLIGGSRKVALGQEIPLVWRGKTFRVKITEVSSIRIAFRDVESGETGTRTMDILPVGMIVGDGRKEITAPGMVPDRPNAPIELGGGDVTMTP